MSYFLSEDRRLSNIAGDKIYGIQLEMARSLWA